MEGARLAAIKALAATCYSRLLLFERPLDNEVSEIPSELELELGLLSAEDLGEYVGLLPGASSAAVLARLRRGDVCFCARRQGDLIAVGWAVSGTARIRYLRGSLSLSADEALIDGVFVAPAQRSRDVWPALGAYGLSWLRDAGYRRTLIAVLPSNRAALRSHAKLGYGPCGIVYGVGVGPLRALIRRSRPAGTPGYRCRHEEVRQPAPESTLDRPKPHG
jgi:GNAT superfamily N-acetyltransferase